MGSQNTKRIKKFWQSRADKDNITDKEVTHRDIWQRWLEIEMIKRFINKNQRVLDVGCGNGYSTRNIAPLVSEIVGIDYSEAMIKRAIKVSYSSKNHIKTSIKFKVKNVLDLDKSDFGLFDVVISERCLINLSSQEDQKKAIANIASILKPGSLFLFIEGNTNGRKNLNELRKKLGLKKMTPVWHNIDFHEEEILMFLSKYFEVEKKVNFGVYDFISRVVHPLIVAPEQPKYDSEINKIAAKLTLDLQEFENISRVLFLVLRRLA